MQYGDLSNQIAPVLVIDVDGLIIHTEKKMFGMVTKLRLNEHAIKICEYHLDKGRSIYLFVHGRTRKEFKEILELLDEYDFPYSRIFHIIEKDRREAILGRNHVHEYFYMEKLHAATDNKRKEKQIFNITEMYF